MIHVYDKPLQPAATKTGSMSHETSICQRTITPEEMMGFTTKDAQLERTRDAQRMQNLMKSSHYNATHSKQTRMGNTTTQDLLQQITI